MIERGRPRESEVPHGATGNETAYTLLQPGRLLEVLEEAMADRLRPGRSGWSASVHLSHDLERYFGIRTSIQVIERALQQLSKHKRIQRMLDDTGTLWYRLRSE